MIQDSSPKKKVKMTNKNGKGIVNIVNINLVQNNHKFEGRYDEGIKPYYETKFIARNTKKQPLVPFRTPDCCKLGCIFQQQKGRLTYSCCSAQQYKFDQMVLDHRLSTLIWNNKISPNQDYNILLVNNILILRNNYTRKEIHQCIWQQANWTESPEDTRGFIKEQFKQNCSIALNYFEKLQPSLNQGQNLYIKITNSEQFKQMKAQLRKQKNNFEVSNEYFNSPQKLGMFYFEGDQKNRHIYLMKQNDQRISVIPVAEYEGNHRQSLGVYFRNNKNQIFSLNKNSITKFVIQEKIEQQIKQDKIRQIVTMSMAKQQIFKEFSDVAFSKGVQAVYAAQSSSLYIVGGGNKDKIYQIKMSGNQIKAKLQVHSGINNCSKCKITLSVDGFIYIIPQDNIVDISEKMIVYKFKPGQKQIKQFSITLNYKNKKILRDQSTIFSTIFQDKIPSLFLSFYDHQISKNLIALISLRGIENGSPSLKIQQISNKIRFVKQQWITDPVGIVLANSSRYLTKIQQKDKYCEVRQVALSIHNGYFYWKVISAT